MMNSPEPMFTSSTIPFAHDVPGLKESSTQGAKTLSCEWFSLGVTHPGEPRDVVRSSSVHHMASYVVKQGMNIMNHYNSCVDICARVVVMSV